MKDLEKALNKLSHVSIATLYLPQNPQFENEAISDASIFLGIYRHALSRSSVAESATLARVLFMVRSDMMKQLRGVDLDENLDKIFRNDTQREPKVEELLLDYLCKSLYRLASPLVHKSKINETELKADLFKMIAIAFSRPKFPIHSLIELNLFIKEKRVAYGVDASILFLFLLQPIFCLRNKLNSLVNSRVFYDEGDDLIAVCLNNSHEVIENKIQHLLLKADNDMIATQEELKKVFKFVEDRFKNGEFWRTSHNSAAPCICDDVGMLCQADRELLYGESNKGSLELDRDYALTALTCLGAAFLYTSKQETLIKLSDLSSFRLATMSFDVKQELLFSFYRDHAALPGVADSCKSNPLNN